jgi:hypothetical protein
MADASRVFIRDVSFAGSTVTLSGGPFGNIEIKDFMDDANPVEFGDVEVSTVGVNLNGAMIRNAKPNIITASITVIPFTQSDAQLYRGWQKYRVQGSWESEWEQPLTLTITIGNNTGGSGGGQGIKRYSYTNGTMTSGPGGPVSNAEGKMQGRTYSFAFVSVS